jgi:hypothetical protein
VDGERELVLFFGPSFGLAESARPCSGALADRTNFASTYQVYAYLPATGILAAALSNPPTRDRRGVKAGAGRVEMPSLRGQAVRSWPGLRPAMRIRRAISAR